MKVQIRRNVFETNSSSTHSISIIKESEKDILSNLPPVLEIPLLEFGWEFETYNDTYTKLGYLWQAIIGYYEYFDKDKIENPLEYEKEMKQSKIDKLVSILAKYGVTLIIPYNGHLEIEKSKYSEDYSYVTMVYDGIKSYNTGYIDHCSETRQFVEAVLEDEQKLLRFLFDNDSYISTGNDNDDAPLEVLHNKPVDEYYKGN